MKVILSRKGFDSDFGGYPSWIMPDSGHLISIPIPTGASRTGQYKNNDFLYKDLKFDRNLSYLDVMQQLGYKYSEKSCCHLDPDIYTNIIDRKPEWLGAFGQVGAAQSHLERYNVKKDDIFLFFGWFKHIVQKEDGTLCIDKKDFDKHLIFGYLQIGEILKLPPESILFEEEIPDWLKYHPHVVDHLRKVKNNTIYIGRKTLSFNEDLPGFGTFTYNKDVVLTKEGFSRTKWQLPEFMREIQISYHTKDHWKEDYFQSVSRGQEFVLEENDKVEEWARGIIERNVII